MLLIILNAIFCIAFILFAYVNLNDGDSWLWVPIYLIAAAFCGLAAFDHYFPQLYLAAVSFYLIYAIVLFFSKDGVKDWIKVYGTPSLVESMQTTKPYIEKAREFFGLLIISAAILINYLVAVY
jgi:hypothetical protein